MNHSPEAPTPPDILPEALITRIDSLEIPELIAILTYVEQRIEFLRTPIEDEIEADAAGEVIEIENHGEYALVRTHPPDPNGSGANTDIISLYHVRREQQTDGTKSLHWAYLGDIDSPESIRCETCGRTLDTDSAVCPHCGSSDGNRSEMED